jgi:microsomal epoxide hydrolase
MQPAARPFSLHVPDEALDDLRRRLEATRWPDQHSGVEWQYGRDLSYRQSLATYLA